MKEAMFMHIRQSICTLVDDGPYFILRHKLCLILIGRLELVQVFFYELKDEANFIMQSNNFIM